MNTTELLREGEPCLWCPINGPHMQSECREAAHGEWCDDPCCACGRTDCDANLNFATL